MATEAPKTSSSGEEGSLLGWPGAEYSGSSLHPSRGDGLKSKKNLLLAVTSDSALLLLHLNALWNDLIWMNSLHDKFFTVSQYL